MGKLQGASFGHPVDGCVACFAHNLTVDSKAYTSLPHDMCKKQGRALLGRDLIRTPSALRSGFFYFL